MKTVPSENTIYKSHSSQGTVFRIYMSKYFLSSSDITVLYSEPSPDVSKNQWNIEPEFFTEICDLRNAIEKVEIFCCSEESSLLHNFHFGRASKSSLSGERGADPPPAKTYFRQNVKNTQHALKNIFFIKTIFCFVTPVWVLWVQVL